MNKLATVLGIIAAIIAIVGGAYGIDVIFARRVDLEAAKTEITLKLDNKEIQLAGSLEGVQQQIQENYKVSEQRYWQQRLDHLHLQKEYYESQLRNKRQLREDVSWIESQLQKIKRHIVQVEEKLLKLEGN
jgi:hypothetical protein